MSVEWAVRGMKWGSHEGGDCVLRIWLEVELIDR